MKPTFSGEVQFAGYADGSRGGPRVTLRLTDRAELEKFVGMEGRRFMAVLVEIGDDEKPAEQPARKWSDMGPNCQWAVAHCKKPEFQQWIRHVYDVVMGGDGSGCGDVTPDDVGGAEKYARHAICVICEVQSRGELDTDDDAAQRLHAQIRNPYLAWLEKQKVTT